HQSPLHDFLREGGSARLRNDVGRNRLLRRAHGSSRGRRTRVSNRRVNCRTQCSPDLLRPQNQSGRSLPVLVRPGDVVRYGRHCGAQTLSNRNRRSLFYCRCCNQGSGVRSRFAQLSSRDHMLGRLRRLGEEELARNRKAGDERAPDRNDCVFHCQRR
ncbi:hypothetical protein KXW38_002022, partial [Aspergillus fumigatus]